jgi:hypothetical protein
MEYKIVTSSRANGLTEKVNELLKDGWECVGSHKVVEKNQQLQFAGSQHRRTEIQSEYSQTMFKN